jgi:ubiquinol-cytochrome c reductase cytochrome b subunit
VTTEVGRRPPESKQSLHSWLQDRLDVDAIWESLFIRKIPFGVNVFYTLGFAALALFVIQVVTGTVLALYYAPSPDHAYDSVQYIQNQLPFGEVIRSIHHWGASAMILVVVLHLIAAFVMGAYKYPREMTWTVGVILLLITFGFGFTGYLLPWDEKAYWATTVGTNMAGTIPFIGGFIVRLLRGGADLGVLTLTRFYAAHVLIFPMMIVAFIVIHLFLVIYQGVSVPPGLWDRWVRSHLGFKDKISIPARNAQYHEYYDHFKALGRRFFPELIVDDAIVAVLAILSVIGLAVFVGAPLESQADPSNTAYVPRPEWYFMFLFQTLKYFPGSLEWIGAILMPAIFVLILLALPFYDRRLLREPRRRPIAMTLGGIIVVASVALTIMAFVTTPPAVVEDASSRLTPQEVTGKQLVQTENCRACHVIEGQGGNVGPALDGIAGRREPAYIHFYIENPKNLNPTAVMPGFIPPLSHDQVEAITRYLLTLK